MVHIVQCRVQRIGCTGGIQVGQRRCHSLVAPARFTRVNPSTRRPVIVLASAQDTIDATVDGAVSALQETAGLLKQALEVTDKGAKAVGDVASKVAPVVEKTTKSVSPIINDAIESYGKPLASSLSSKLSETGPQVGKLVQDAGVSPDIVQGASKAVSATKPFVTSAVDFVTTTPPLTLAEYAAGVGVGVLALPGMLSLLGAVLRGFAGFVTPAGVLDKLSTSQKAVLIDIRSEREKESAGIPDMREKSKYIQIEFASVDDGRVRRELKNIADLEATMTALQVAALKKISKASEVYLMDKNGSSSKVVARKLASKGFKNVYVVNGGYSAWQRERLPSRMATSVSNVEVIAPGQVLFGSTKKKSDATKQIAPTPARKALPSGSRN